MHDNVAPDEDDKKDETVVVGLDIGGEDTAFQLEHKRIHRGQAFRQWHRHVPQPFHPRQRVDVDANADERRGQHVDHEDAVVAEGTLVAGIGR